MSETGELVFCRSEVDYAERPLALVWQGQRLAVVEVLTRWRTPEEQAFRVLCEDQRVFDLFYNLARDCWSITLQ